MSTSPPPQPILEFASQELFRAWLTVNQNDETGIFLRIYKKDSGVATVTYDQALEEALCFGWIDGIKKSYDALSWIQRFTPRRKRSIWSKRNIGIVEKLSKEGRITERGLQEITAAQQDGRWAQAYDSQKNALPPEDFMNALKKSKKAFTFYNSLNAANKYAIAFRLHTAKKPETYTKRKEQILTMMREGKKFH